MGAGKKNEVEFILRAKNLAKGGLRAVGVDVDRLGRQVKQFNAVGAKIKHVGAGIRSAGVAISVAGAAMTAAMAAPVKMATEAETGLARVATLLDGDLSRTVGMFDKDLKALSVQTGQTMATLQEGLYDTISAGVPAAQAMDFLRVASITAAGGFTDVKTAGGGVISMLNSYGLGAEHALKISDQMAIAVKAGVTTFEQLSGAVGRAASTAANFGVSSGDYLASVATLTKAGISTDEAVTAVRALLTAIANPQEKAGQLLESLQAGIPEAEKIKFSITSLKDKGLVQYFQQLIKATGGEAEAMNALIGTNIRASAGFMSLSAQADAFTETAREMATAGGANSLTLRNFETVAETAAFQFKQLRSEIVVLMITLGNALLPTLVGIVNWFKPIVAGVTAWVENNRELADGIGKVLVIAAGLMVVLGPVIALIGLLAGAIGAIVAAAPVLAIIAKVVGVIGGAVAIVAGLNKAMGGALDYLFGKKPQAVSIGIDAPKSRAAQIMADIQAAITGMHEKGEDARTKASKEANAERIRNLMAGIDKAKAAAGGILTLSADQYERLKGRFWLGGGELAGIMAGMGGAGFAGRALAGQQPAIIKKESHIHIEHLDLPDVADPDQFAQKLWEKTMQTPSRSEALFKEHGLTMPVKKSQTGLLGQTYLNAY